MRLNEYQHNAVKTAIYPEAMRTIYPALGLCGEAGEVAEKIKKMLRDDGGNMSEDRRMGLRGELGDVLWYISAIARDIGFTLEEIAEANIVKLAKRQKENKLQGDGDNR